MHTWDDKDRTLKTVPGSGGVSSARNALEGGYAWAWARERLAGHARLIARDARQKPRCGGAFSFQAAQYSATARRAQLERGLHRPVLPKPPAPRALAANSSTTSNSTCTTGTTTSCAMRSSGWIVNAALPRFHTETKICPW